MSLQCGLTTFAINAPDQPTSSEFPVTKKQPRSTTGCSNCKRRKVKCDERKPTCSRCNDRRLRCPGYPTNALKWSAKHEIHKPSTSEQTTLLSPLSATSEPEIQEVARLDRGLDEYNNFIDSATRHNPHHGEPTRPYWALSPIYDITASPSYSDNYQLALPLIHSTSSNDESAAGFLLTESPPVTFETPSAIDELPEHAVVRHFSHDLYGDHPSIYSTDTSCQDDVSVENPENVIQGRKNSTQDILTLGNSTALLVSRPDIARSGSSLLSPTILHVPTVLVEYYFRNVCRDCSTYDSSYNPFRSTVAEMQFNSAPINYAIQSLAASKLADDMPQMKVTGIETQGMALEHLKRESIAADGLHNVSEEVLCSILLLGMTTSWHVRDDLGVEYLLLARRIIVAKSQAPGMILNSNLSFYQNALKYWTMIVSIVSDRAGDFDGYDDDFYADLGPVSSSPSAPLKKIMPHPWTGISPAPQQLFGQVLQLIRKTRSDTNRKQSSGYSRARIASLFNAITAAELLEAKCWSLRIPAVDDIKDTEDTSTPSIHHVLTAKAYILAALLHIYMIFPDVLESRLHQVSSSANERSVFDLDLRDMNMAHIFSTATVWPQRSSGDGHELWLRDLGLRIVECLEGIEVKSGTRVVHPPLLLSVASVLVFVSYEERTSTLQNTKYVDNLHTIASAETNVSKYSQSTEDQNIQVRQCRTFIINRLETMHALMRFHAIDNILKIVKEVWRRADLGLQDVFWMDVMHELRCESIFG